MNKSKKLLLFSIVLGIVFVGTIPIVSGRDSREYQNPFNEKLYGNIKTIHFTFSSESITYGLYFGVMFEMSSLTHMRVISDAYLICLSDYWVTNLEATLNFNLVITCNGYVINITNSIQDSSPFFMSGSNIIHEFEGICNEEINLNYFPSLMSVVFDYSLTSSQFSAAETYSKTQLILGSRVAGILIALVTIAIIVGALSITFVIMRRRKSQKRDYQMSLTIPDGKQHKFKCLKCDYKTDKLLFPPKQCPQCLKSEDDMFLPIS